jgi:hypothetical protein
VVAISSDVSHCIAAVALSPHISADGMSCPHTAGRPGWPKIRQALVSSSWMQRTPAGLPWGMPGIGELMDGATQQAPQPGRQFIAVRYKNRSCRPSSGGGWRPI